VVERFDPVFRQTGRHSGCCGGSSDAGHAQVEKKTTSHKGMNDFRQTPANPAPPGNSASPSLFHALHPRRAVPEEHRSGDMRQMKISRQLLPLYLALGLVVGSVALSSLFKSHAVEMAITALHFPAGILAFLVLPAETFTKSGNPALYMAVAFTLAVLQWYLIFAAGLWLLRRSRKGAKTT
jgi:hypothetical protein